MLMTTKQLKNIISEALLSEGVTQDTIKKYVTWIVGKFYDNASNSLLPNSRDTVIDILVKDVLGSFNIHQTARELYRALGLDNEAKKRSNFNALNILFTNLNEVVYFLSQPVGPKSSPNKYLDWMLNQSLVRNEPEHEVLETVKEFEKYKHIQPREINHYKTLGELRAAIEGDTLKRAQKIKVAPDQYDKVYEDNQVIVVHPKTKEASCKYGAGTRWCISATKSKNYFDKYDEAGTKHFFIIRKQPQGNEWDKVSVSFLTKRGAADACTECDGTGYNYEQDQDCEACGGAGYEEEGPLETYKNIYDAKDQVHSLNDMPNDLMRAYFKTLKGKSVM